MDKVHISFVIGYYGNRPDIFQCVHAIHANMEDIDVTWKLYIVDQNLKKSHERALIEKIYPNVEFIASEKGLSRARNKAIQIVNNEFSKSFSDHSLVCFPDDDCIYPKDLIKNVIKYFNIYGDDIDVLTCSIIDSDGCNTMNKSSLVAEGFVDINYIDYIACSFTMFIKCNRFQSFMFFDERLGLGSGTNHNASEDLDYILRYAKLGKRIFHVPSLTIFHPNKIHTTDGNVVALRSFTYALSDAVVFKKHRLFWLWFRHFTRSIFGLFIYLLRLNFRKGFLIYGSRVLGYFSGYFLRND